MTSVAVVVSERLARYGFGDGHPFGPDRLAAFVREFSARGLPQRVTVLEPHDLDAIRTEIRDRFGLTARFAHFPIVGLCAECAATGAAHHH